MTRLCVACLLLLAVPAWAQEGGEPVVPVEPELTEVLSLQRELLLKDIRIMTLQITVWEREQELETLRLNQRVADLTAVILEETGAAYDVLEGAFVAPETLEEPVP